MKTCSRCKVIKPFEAFHRNASRKDGFQTYCKPCKSTYTREWYIRNGEVHRVRVVEHRRAHEARAMVFLDQMKSRPCADCGGRFPPEAMDFDHVSGIKSGAVSQMRTVARVRLLAEIAKCEVVCVNCHRRRTADRRQAKNA